MPLSSAVEKLARKFKEKVMAAWGPRILEMRVFGSMARGTSHEDSDVDVFVMVDRRDRELWNAIVDAACEVSEEVAYRPPIAPLVMSADRFEELLRRERRIARDIRSEGIPI